jgi:ABC-type nitrate/sulfonate/bicarbonate transport system substrate-binding protein
MKRHHIVLPRREFLKVGAAGVLGTFIAAATRNVAGAQTPSMENVMANLKTLRMGDFNPNYATQWSYRLAQALGYFKAVGIDNLEVTLSEEYMPGLIGGSLDITHGDTSVFFGSGEKSGLPIKMVSLYRDKEWWIMGVRKGIDKPEDLKGGKITGGGLQGRNTWVMKQVLTEMGLDPEKDVSFVPMRGGSDARLQALLAGTVDAASLFPRHQPGLEAAGGKFLSAKLHEVPQEGFAAMGTWLSANEDTAYAWARADIKARQWMFDPANKDESYKTMRGLGFDIPPAFEAQYKLELDQISPDGGFASGEVMDKFVASLAVTGDVPEGLDWRKYVDMKYVWAGQEANGLKKRPASL